MPMTTAPFPRAILLFLIAGLLTLGLAAPARAQSCTFSASNIVLGPVDVLGSSPTTATGNIAVNCSTFLGLLTSITVTIELGDGSAGLFGSLRRLGGRRAAAWPMTCTRTRPTRRSSEEVRERMAGSPWS